MAKTILFSGGTGSNTSTAGTVQYICPIGNTRYSTTEANAQILMRTAGTIYSLTIRTSTTGTSANTPMILRKNGADTSIIVTLPAGTSGNFSDTADTVTIAAGDLLSIKSNASGTGTFVLYQIKMEFDTNASTTSTVTRLAASNAAGNTGHTAASTSYYYPLVSHFPATTATNTTESAAQTQQPISATLKNLAVGVRANSRTTTTTVRTRKNTANGNQAIAFTNANGTGFFEDTSNTDSIAANDLVNYAIVNGTGTSAITYSALCIDHETTTDPGTGHLIISDTTPLVHTRNTTSYAPIGGRYSGTLISETLTQIPVFSTFIVKYLSIRTTANSLSTGATVTKLRVNGADSALSVSVAAGATGWVVDSTNSVTLAVNDLINYSTVIGVGSGTQTLSIQTISAYTQLAGVSTGQEKTGSDSITFIHTTTMLRGLIQTNTDSLVLTQTSTNRLRSIFRGHTSALSIITDTNKYRMLLQISTDTLSLIHTSTNKVRNKIIAFSEAVSLTHTSSNRLRTVIRLTTVHNLSMLHTTDRLRLLLQLFSQGLALSESGFSRLRMKIGTFANSISFLEAVNRLGYLLRVFAESIGFTNANVYDITGRVRGFSESLGLNHASTSYLKLKLAGFAQALGLTAIHNSMTARLRSYSEAFVLSSTTIRIKTIGNRLIAGGNLSLSTAGMLRIKSLTRVLGVQSLGLSEVYSRLRFKNRTLAETLVIISSSPATLRTKLRVFADSINLAELMETSVGVKLKYFSNSIVLNANIIRLKAISKTSADSIIFTTPAFLRIKLTFRSFSNSLSLIAVTDQMKLLLKGFSNAIGPLTSTNTRLRGKIVTSSNSISLTEFINRLRFNVVRYFSSGTGPLSSVAVKSKVLSRAFTTSFLLTSNFVNERGIKIKTIVENLVLVASNPIRLTNRIKSTSTQTLGLSDVSNKLRLRFKNVAVGNLALTDLLTQLKAGMNRVFTVTFSLNASAPNTISTRFKKFTENLSLNYAVLKRLTKLPTSEEEISASLIKEKLKEPELFSDAQRQSDLYNKIVVKNMHPYIKKDQIDMSPKPDHQVVKPSKSSGEMSADSYKVMDRIRKGMNKYF